MVFFIVIETRKSYFKCQQQPTTKISIEDMSHKKYIF